MIKEVSVADPIVGKFIYEKNHKERMNRFSIHPKVRIVRIFITALIFTGLTLIAISALSARVENIPAKIEQAYWLTR